VIAVSANDRHLVEVISRAAVDQIHGQGNVNYLLSALRISVPQEEVETVNMSIGGSKGKPTSLIRLGDWRGTIEAGITQVIRPSKVINEG
jgi:hypothetical protein